jgi:RNA polymerase sigma factor (sigma-70 family)
MEANPNDEQELIARFNKGDAAAFGQIYQLFYPKMCFFANGLIHQPEESKDIAGNVFMKLWERRDKFDSLINIKAFLYITTRNECFDLLDKRRVRNKANIPQPDPEEQRKLIVRTETYLDTYHLIKNLEGNQRKVLELILEGHSMKEIAQLLNLQEANIRKLKFRALTELRELLQKK